jgi:hypothetical protein
MRFSREHRDTSPVCLPARRSSTSKGSRQCSAKHVRRSSRFSVVSFCNSHDPLTTTLPFRHCITYAKWQNGQCIATHQHRDLVNARLFLQIAVEVLCCIITPYRHRRANIIRYKIEDLVAKAMWNSKLVKYLGLSPYPYEIDIVLARMTTESNVES